MSSALISMGSNVPDRKEFLHQAIMRLTFSCRVLSISDIYETFGHFEKRDPYLNCCVELETDMTSQQLLLFLLETEKQIGEDKQVHELKTAIDLDLIGYDQEITRTPKLTIPHPEAHRRAFVMIPLAQIKPHWMHPLLKKSAEDLAKAVYWAGWGTFFASGKSLLDF
jgi:2-amino-4-hydroxy-6-hydroxymethyldihydropteridine diphosphokinase